jgi:hypothetical protein
MQRDLLANIEKNYLTTGSGLKLHMNGYVAGAKKNYRA